MNLNKTLVQLWRSAPAHRVEQGMRLARIALFAFVGQVVAQLVAQLASSGDIHSVTHMGTKAATALLVGAGETAYREYKPALTAAATETVPTPALGGTVVSSTDVTPAAPVASGNVSVVTNAVTPPAPEVPMPPLPPLPPQS